MKRKCFVAEHGTPADERTWNRAANAAEDLYPGFYAESIKVDQFDGGVVVFAVGLSKIPRTQTRSRRRRRA